MQPTENKIQLNWKLFYTGAIALLIGYASMATCTAAFIRLTAAPILILTGFGFIAASILSRK